MTDTKKIPLHAWTNGGDRVLLVKCVNMDMTGHNGFKWPEAGPVKPETWSRDANCASGGLFGWPWGIGLGEGKEILPDSKGRWLVFAVWPDNVIEISGKSKAVPGNDGVLPEVVFCGTMADVMKYTSTGRIAWIEHWSSGAASNSGDSGAASNSGDRGAASNSGYRGAASNSGSSGAASNSGDSGAASNSGDRGAASNSGYRGAASNSGSSGAASNSGSRGIACSTGEYSTIETSATGLAAITANIAYWRVRKGAVLVQRWAEENKSGMVVFDANKRKLKDGALYEINCGKIKLVNE